MRMVLFCRAWLEASHCSSLAARRKGCDGYPLCNYHRSMLNDRLKKLRLSRGLTLQQVGEHFGISVASVANWENGKSQPDSRKLSRLADLLGSNVTYLLEGKNPPIISNEELLYRSVPFISWSQIGTKDISDTSPVLATPLHTELSKSGFATRYPGTSDFNWSQGPIPAGALIFVDPQKELKPDSLVLLVTKDSSPCFARVQMPINGGHFLKPINSSDSLTSSEEVKVLGCVLEWRISGAVN